MVPVDNRFASNKLASLLSALFNHRNTRPTTSSTRVQRRSCVVSAICYFIVFNRASVLPQSRYHACILELLFFIWWSSLSRLGQSVFGSAYDCEGLGRGWLLFCCICVVTTSLPQFFSWSSCFLTRGMVESTVVELCFLVTTYGVKLL